MTTPEHQALIEERRAYHERCRREIEQRKDAAAIYALIGEHIPDEVFDEWSFNGDGFFTHKDE